MIFECTIDCDVKLSYDFIFSINFFLLRCTHNSTIYTENCTPESHFFQQRAGKSPPQKGSRLRAGVESFWGTGTRSDLWGHNSAGLCIPCFPPVDMMVEPADRVISMSYPKVGLKAQWRCMRGQDSTLIVHLAV